ncbi:MAG TPA: ribosome silencing factor [Bacteroidia bacterium]|mgnify:CR=1 FL=1|nr:ribosome silencing factor [Bacteroidia bacterium]HRS58515.1 ribosome silencing factor [Bacteroidia bacterium]HRU68546.1 ribosome silencing factor [Bacteroidia bacterium]
MTEKREATSLEQLKNTIIQAIQDKKGNNIVSIDLRNLKNPITDFFIICHGTSDRQVEAIAENIEKEVFLKNKEKPFIREGYQNKEWILIDYFDVIVHVFLEEKRTFFDLESLWGDGILTTYN